MQDLPLDDIFNFSPKFDENRPNGGISPCNLLSFCPNMMRMYGLSLVNFLYKNDGLTPCGFFSRSRVPGDEPLGLAQGNL